MRPSGRLVQAGEGSVEEVDIFGRNVSFHIMAQIYLHFHFHQILTNHINLKLRYNRQGISSTNVTQFIQNA